MYRKQLVASEIYQAIKRVNRDMSQETNVVIITKDNVVFNMICDMLPNCKLIQESKYNYQEFAFKRKKIKHIYDNFELDKIFGTYAQKTITLFRNILEGSVPEEIKTKDSKGVVQKNKYRKKKIGQYIGIDYNKKNASSIFCNKVLNKVEVIDFMKRNRITEKGQYIFFE